MHRLKKTIKSQACRVYKACKVSRRHFLYFKDSSLVKQNRYWLAVLLYCSGIGCPPRDLKQQGLVSKAVNCQDVSMFSHLLGDTL